MRFANWSKIVLPAALLLGACAHPARTPPLEKTARAPAPAPPPAPPQKNVFSRTADATWNVVQAPVKFMLPPKPAAPAAEPLPPGPVEGVVVPRYRNADVVTETTAEPAPATQP